MTQTGTTRTGTPRPGTTRTGTTRPAALAGPARRSAWLGGFAVLAAVLSGCTVTNGVETVASGTSTGAGAASGSSAKPSGPSGSALKMLATIRIKGRAPATGYSREQFGTAWKDTDHNGCDQRNDILRRDLTRETLKPGTHGCVVLSGVLVDHYTGTTIAFSKSSAAAVQIDHVVALENAWVTGAYAWTATKRTALATDPLNLLAVDGPTNESKGSGDAATWLPRKAYRCDYVARQVAVKAKYGAWMTAAEHTTIQQILTSCPGEKLPQEQAIPLGSGAAAPGSASSGPAAPTTAGSPGPSAPTKTGSSGPSGGTKTGVSPGAFCSPVGATGTTASGTPMVCSAKDGDRARWRTP
jgi:hypothetical protein